MGKTIKAALRDEMEYPLKDGFIENKLIMRELNGNEEFTVEVARSSSFRGAVADCLKGLIYTPNVSEGDISISQTDKNNMLAIANSIYKSIGEDEANVSEKPIVHIGG